MPKDDRYYQESIEGVQAVLERMMALLGNPLAGSYAEVLDINENTLKTWRKRGAISLKYLQGFAKKHNVPIDYLIRGNEGEKEFQHRLNAIKSTSDLVANMGLPVEQTRRLHELLSVLEIGDTKRLAALLDAPLASDESALLHNYRLCPPEGKAALKATSAALAAGNPPPTKKLKQVIKGNSNQVAGRDLTNHQGVTDETSGGTTTRGKRGK